MSPRTDPFGRPLADSRPQPSVPSGEPLAPPAPVSPAPSESPGRAPRTLAGWGERFAATFIDGIIVMVVFVGLAVAVGQIWEAPSLDAPSGNAVLFAGLSGIGVWLLATLVYAPLLMARAGRRNGQTLGKQAIGIAVERDDGTPVGFGFAAVREAGVKGLLYGIVGQVTVVGALAVLVAYLWPLWDRENRAVHDRIVKTHVVDR